MYHQGEMDAQAITGEGSIGARNGRAIANKIIPGAVNFIENQPFFIASSRKAEGDIVASVLSGEKNFIKVLDASTLLLNRRLITSNPCDPFWLNSASLHPIGTLFIEPVSRRRYRMNGKVQPEGDNFIIQIDQAYPNCPKYIQRRHFVNEGKPVYLSAPESGNSLPSYLEDMIRNADTFFVGSGNEAGDLDASHRGGLPGFITVEADGSMLIPDYQGNSMYNTLGNFLQNPKAGLLFIDFQNNKTLQLSGKSEVIWNDGDPYARTGGTGRFWKFFPENWTLMENHFGSIMAHS